MSYNSIIRQWNGRTIRQRKDGYLSATDMCQACNKLFADWRRLKSTNEYLRALRESMGIPIDQLIEINESIGGNDDRGTWVHRRISIRLAQWLSSAFAVQVDEWTEELMVNGTVALVKSVEQTPAQIAQIAIAEAEVVINWTIQSLGIDETIGKQMKIDMLGNRLPHLKPSLEPIKQLVGASNPLETVGMNATQLGEHLSPARKAREVNDLLEEIGLQYKMHRTSTKTGKQKYIWQVTEEGQKHAAVHLISNNDFSGSQIKWQKSVVKLIQEHLDNK